MRNGIERQSDREAFIQPVIDFADRVRAFALHPRSVSSSNGDDDVPQSN